MQPILPVTTSLAFIFVSTFVLVKFTAYKEKVQINISSGSCLLFLLLSANTQPSVPLRLWWKTQMCIGVCIQAVWLCGAVTNPCISYITDIAYFFVAICNISMIYLKNRLLSISVISMKFDLIQWCI